ncbi:MULTISPECIES: ABC transporter permease [Paenibacillus]|uniref:ABC transporter permease n=1 Tax=Paenibacillus TaxID=44249 RepID=UPI0022B8EB9B|nr:FtsX-like permease family protein [Paenibacillus caseinilyticus]MCZ8521069.1 ABC transporter permease [Paenibacillus caseinilyticus]
MIMLLWRNLLHRKMLSLLTILSVALTVGLLVFLLLVKAGIEEGAAKGYGPFELVVGADGSETQLVLNTFYHVDAPTGNIPYAVFEKLAQEKETAAAYALTTGDNYNGYPIVGIEPGYFPERYGDRKLAEGRLYAASGEVVIGAHAAKELGVRVGDTFKGGHGLVDTHGDEEEGHADEEAHEGETGEEAGHADGEEKAGAGHESDAHASFVYHVVGILPSLNSADDRAVFTTVDYAWKVHGAAAQEHREVTAVLVKPRSIGGAQSLKLAYDKLDNVQAVYTSKAVADVVNLVDQGSALLNIVSLLCVLLAAISVLLSLVAAAGERRKDAGLLRLIGKPASFIWFTMLGEGLLITAIGLVLGLFIGHVGSFLGAGAMFEFSGIHVAGLTFQSGEGWLAAGTLLIGAAASLGPAARVYRADPLQLFRS